MLNKTFFLFTIIVPNNFLVYYSIILLKCCLAYLFKNVHLFLNSYYILTVELYELNCVTDLL